MGVKTLLGAVTSTTTGTAASVPETIQSFQITTAGTVNVTVVIEASLDGTNYGTLFSKAYSSATTELYGSEGLYTHYRAKTNPHVSGTVTVLMSS